MYNYLIVGAGLYGAVFAREAADRGKSGLVIEKRPHIAGTVDTEKVEGDFDASDFVKETTGVDNVCERSAILLTQGMGSLVVRKTALDGVTVAVARRYGV